MSFRDIFDSQQKTITGAAIILTVSILLSRVLGLLRDRFLAGTFGASLDLDIYFAAFRIPDLVYSIIFAGGVLVSLLPVFSNYYEKMKKEEGWNLINNVLNLFILFFVIASCFFCFFTPQIVSSMVNGFDAHAKEATIVLTRLIFLSVFFFGLSSIFSTILNYFNRFVSYSIAPILYNLGIIFGILFLSPYFGIFGAGIGVVIGSILHLLIQIPPAIRCGYKYRFVLNPFAPEVKEFVGLMIPRTIASSTAQINFIIITFIASSIGTGAISVFNLSNNLRYLPIGIIGVSFATAVFPSLSKLWAEGNKEEFRFQFRKVFLQVLYISFPIGILMYILRNEIVDIILRTGNFGTAAAGITATCLGLYVISTCAQCLVPVLLRGFFSLKDTATPTIIAMFFVAFNIIASFFFVSLFSGAGGVINFSSFNPSSNSVGNVPVIGLVYAFNLSLLTEFILLFIFFVRKVGNFGLMQLAWSFFKVLVSSIVMAYSAYYVIGKIQTIFSDSFVDSLIKFAIVCSVSFIVYFLSGLILKSQETGYFLKRLKNEN
jgi:putative peptidoglycan lipid II flippase